MTLRAGELPPERAAALVEECARLAVEAGAELDRQVRAADAARRGGAAGARVLSWATRTICAPTSRPTSRAALQRRSRRRTASRRRCATRCWRAASASGPVLALATAHARRDADRGGPPARRRARAHPHLLADPRRPAGDGRRLAAPRPAHLPRPLRRGHRDPGRRRALRRGDPARPRRAARRSRTDHRLPVPS